MNASQQLIARSAKTKGTTYCNTVLHSLDDTRLALAKGLPGPIVRFMHQKINDLGGDLHKGNIKCVTCDEAQGGGGLHPDYGIMLCANRPEPLEDTLTHGKARGTKAGTEH